MARDGALHVLHGAAVDLGATVAAADMGGAHSSLVRRGKNLLRPPAPVVYTFAANAGVLDAAAVGGEDAPPAAAVAALRHSGQWHSQVTYPHVRPEVGHVAQVLSMAAAAAGDRSRCRGVEWVLLSQLATGTPPAVPAGVTLPLVPLSLSQVGLTRAPALLEVAGRASAAGAF